MSVIYSFFEIAMRWCYTLCGNYGVAIILFTLFSKVIILPISVWVQKNSIKMVKMQPEINLIKVRHYGDPDAISEEQTKLYKREKYNPFASIFPTIVQLILLMGVIHAIKACMQDTSINMMFLGIDLSLVPCEIGGLTILAPLVAGASAWLMCSVQNRENVLQSEQSNLSKYGMLAFSVLLSLCLGWFVSLGVAVYWVASNLLSIIQLLFLNRCIDPRKYVDYEALEDSNNQLNYINSLGPKTRDKDGKQLRKREKADYKRFFSIANKHLVFYSETSGYYKYYKGIIEYLLQHTNIVIHYITSDPKDTVFELAQHESQIKPYYIGEKKLITLMMKMDADVVVMTMPDLNTYHIKRSYVRNDIEYIYIPHAMNSLNLTMRTGSMNHYDTIFCTGKHQREEAEKTDIAYNLPKRKMVEWGYSLLDDMIADYESGGTALRTSEYPTVLIAPSWQEDNIVDSCLDRILQLLSGTNYRVIVRPHPQHVRHCRKELEALRDLYSGEETNIEIQLDFSSNDTVFSADVLVTDWSGIAYEYAFTTKKPVLFINTPMKIMNPEYQRIDTVPLNIWMRDEIGCSLELNHIDDILNAINNLLQGKDAYARKISDYVNQYVYNVGCAGEAGAKYIISAVKAGIERKNKENA